MLSKLKNPIFYLALIITLGFAVRYFMINAQAEDKGKAFTQGLEFKRASRFLSQGRNPKSNAIWD